MHFDLIIIGAGAAGLLGAINAAESGLSTLLLEKNRKLGVKILMSGGTRCNITQNTDSKGIVAAFGEQGPFLHSALAQFSTGDIIDLLKKEGVETKTEPTGKIFPVSNRAIDVRDALVNRMRRAGTTVINDCAVTACRKTNESFEVTTPGQTFHAKRLLITTGGSSYPGCGTNGDGYIWAREFGHKIVPPRPALTPLLTNAAWVRQLSGVTIGDVECELDCQYPKRQKHNRHHSRGSFLFTHFGFSGPTPLNVSRELINSRTKMLTCDFLPELKPHELETDLSNRIRSDGKKIISSISLDAIPGRLFEALLQMTDIDPNKRCAELSKAQIAGLISALKSCQIPISGTKGFAKAEVTAGGVSLDEVDSRTMQSKLVPGLYFAGEILDLDGPIGGYNFQAAFSTAWLATSNMSPISLP